MNVFDAALCRMRKVFDLCDQVVVAFSGGKDSGVLLELALLVAAEFDRKVTVMHLDYEAQYQQTTDYVDSTLAKHADKIDVYRICLPFKSQCSTSMHQDHWRPWESAKRDIWVRNMPENAINEENNPFDFWKERMWDYDVQEAFAPWLHKKTGAKRTAVLVGIRTQESLNRWRAIHSDRNNRKLDNIQWSKEMASDVYNFYPIFDWQTEDVWTAVAKNNWEYNKLYDLFHLAGVPLHAMRVASPFNDYAKGSLHLYRAIDPNGWSRMVGRVNGANFTSIYGGTTAMGWRGITLPKGHTWKSYMEFLLDTLPEEVAENYRSKLETSIKFWREKGGVLDDDTIADLKASGAEISVSTETNYRTHKKPVRMEYLDDIDTKSFSLVPTYKRMCICIMKNDHLCKYMGFSQTKYEMEKRKKTIQKYKDLL